MNDEELTGKSIIEIRAALTSGESSLVVTGEPVEPGWPIEMVKIDRENDSVLFQYQDAQGNWQYFYAFGYTAYRDQGKLPGLLYERVEIDGSLVVEPVALLFFDENGVCTSASRSWVEGLISRRKAGELGYARVEETDL